MAALDAATEDRLIQAARAVRARAYAPYSGFRVGAALLDEAGAVHAACNVENAAYPQSQCAEASAIGVLVATGARSIRAVVVAGEGENPVTPCGGCRQRLREFAADDTPVLVADPSGLRLRTTLGELLPHAFGPAHLEPGRVSAAHGPEHGPARAAQVDPAVQASAARLRAALGERPAPRVALLLGSGWGATAEAVQDVVDVDYAELPAFPVLAVGGHAGRVRLGTLGGRAVAMLLGRAHAYESGEAHAMRGAVRTLAHLGCRVLVQTNAAGSLDASMPPGRVMLLSDHLNLPQRSPLVHERDDSRFVDMRDAYDPQLRAQARRCAEALGLPLHEGVYAWVMGPQFETPAEIRMLRLLGAQAVGMSTVPETILARHAGLRVLALSLVTNLACGVGDETLSHAHTLQAAARASADAGALLRAIVAGLDEPD